MKILPLKIKRITPSLKLINLLNTNNSHLLSVYKINDDLNVIITVDGPEKIYHLSISHQERYPTYDEIKSIKYTFFPDRHLVMHFPSDKDYVNIHANCFHLFELSCA